MDRHLWMFSFIFNHRGVYRHVDVIHVPYLLRFSPSNSIYTFSLWWCVAHFSQLIFNRYVLSWDVLSNEFFLNVIQCTSSKISKESSRWTNEITICQSSSRENKIRREQSFDCVRYRENVIQLIRERETKGESVYTCSLNRFRIYIYCSSR